MSIDEINKDASLDFDSSKSTLIVRNAYKLGDKYYNIEVLGNNGFQISSELKTQNDLIKKITGIYLSIEKSYQTKLNPNNEELKSFDRCVYQITDKDCELYSKSKESNEDIDLSGGNDLYPTAQKVSDLMGELYALLSTPRACHSFSTSSPVDSSTTSPGLSSPSVSGANPALSQTDSGASVRPKTPSSDSDLILEIQESSPRSQAAAGYSISNKQKQEMVGRAEKLMKECKKSNIDKNEVKNILKNLMGFVRDPSWIELDKKIPEKPGASGTDRTVNQIIDGFKAICAKIDTSSSEYQKEIIDVIIEHLKGFIESNKS